MKDNLRPRVCSSGQDLDVRGLGSTESVLSNEALMRDVLHSQRGGSRKRIATTSNSQSNKVQNPIGVKPRSLTMKASNSRAKC